MKVGKLYIESLWLFLKFILVYILLSYSLYKIEKLLNLTDSEEFLPTFKNIPLEINTEEILEAAYSLSLSHKLLSKLDEKFNNQANKMV